MIHEHESKKQSKAGLIGFAGLFALEIRLSALEERVNAVDVEMAFAHRSLSDDPNAAKVIVKAKLN